MNPSAQEGHQDEASGRSSGNPEPQLLLESGPMLLKEFNPKGVLRFQGRKCLSCGMEIMDHWLIDSPDADAKGRYWCDKDGKTYSEGITDTVWDVPKDFGSQIEQA